MSGFKLDSDLDLLSQEKVIKTMFRKIATGAKSTSFGYRSTAAISWTFGPSTSLKVVIGQLRLGFLRRPILPDTVTRQIVCICMDAQSKCAHHADFGIGFKVKVCSEERTRWLPSSIAIIGETRQQALHVRRKALGKTEVGVSAIVKHIRPAPSDAEAQRCYFGHDATSATTSGNPHGMLILIGPIGLDVYQGTSSRAALVFKRLIG